MSYEKDTIKKIIKDIDGNKIYLPALQRKFVWSKHQIELLFDSLMRNYPFGTFLFWSLSGIKAKNNYVFYEFLKEYDQRSPYNRRKTGTYFHDEIIGVLDGQQRLSSMYIGLMGTHTEKARYKRASNPDAYEKMRLYLNILSLPYEIGAGDKIDTLEDKNFEFRFLTDEAALSNVSRQLIGEDGHPLGREAMLWVKVEEVLSWDEEPEFDRLAKSFLTENATVDQKRTVTQDIRLITKGLKTLQKRICEDPLISYFKVEKDDLEDILKIFVRVNSGGTVLSRTDLLFSTIVATWDDGRDQIETLLKKINEKGDKFLFGNEYLMRCCLVLTDGPVRYKVNSFKSENVQKIRDEWPKIAKAVSKTVDLLVELGFNGNLLTSQNATIIIAYYIYKGGSLNDASKKDIQKYLIHALLKGIYGSAQEQIISTLRGAFRKEVKSGAGKTSYLMNYNEFSFEEVLKIKLPGQRTLAITEGELEDYLEKTKGPTSFFLLSLLYPQLRFNEIVFHQDHMHPAAGFAEDNFREIGVPVDQLEKWNGWRDCVPNLQLMKDRENESKNATPLEEWIEQMETSERNTFFRDNYFPEEVSLKFCDFEAFFKTRRQILRNELKKVLVVINEPTSEPEIVWGEHNEEIEVQETRISEELNE
jgi:uncharacterized protein with ParB-like and HNH nuclease domain